MKVAIVDYGMGNLRSIVGALSAIGISDVTSTSIPSELANSDKLILPGVGHFAAAMKNIREKQLDELIPRLVKEEGKPILGICLGMQLLGEYGSEGGVVSGLNLIEGAVERFDLPGVKVPHVGFNQIEPHPSSRLCEGLGPSPDFYFTHSYRMTSLKDIGQSMCVYEEPFVASVEQGAIAGTQFHPELSQTNGLKLLKNFLEKF
jgi:glutamine amidotransferase